MAWRWQISRGWTCKVAALLANVDLGTARVKLDVTTATTEGYSIAENFWGGRGGGEGCQPSKAAVTRTRTGDISQSLFPSEEHDLHKQALEPKNHCGKEGQRKVLREEADRKKNRGVWYLRKIQWLSCLFKKSFSPFEQILQQMVFLSKWSDQGKVAEARIRYQHQQVLPRTWQKQKPTLPHTAPGYLQSSLLKTEPCRYHLLFSIFCLTWSICYTLQLTLMSSKATFCGEDIKRTPSSRLWKKK